MFGTSIHWTTFFYLLVDTFIVLFAFYQSKRLKRSGLKRYLYLGLLYIIYNFTGGFLPFGSFSGPFILQYIITYTVAITLCIYLIYYLYKEYDIIILRFQFSIWNISVLVSLSFLVLFLIPYFITQSLFVARLLFTLPIAIVGFYFIWAFIERIKKHPASNSFASRRNTLSIFSVSSIVLLPILTAIGDYQWLTFSVMNIAFYAVTTIEIERYLYFLENKGKMFEVFALYKANKNKLIDSKLIYQSLTRREIEISLSILSKKSYRKIGNEFFITERTVSKHASNIFKKTGVKNKVEFVKRFTKNKKWTFFP